LQEVTAVSSKSELTYFDVGDVYERRVDGERVVLVSLHSCYAWYVPADELPAHAPETVSSVRPEDSLQAAADMLPDDGDVQRMQEHEFRTSYRRVEA
jgi:hypothetical protein